MLVEVYPQGSVKIWAVSSSYEDGSHPEITLEREISALPGLKKKDKEEVGQAGLSEKGTLQVLSESRRPRARPLLREHWLSLSPSSSLSQPP